MAVNIGIFRIVLVPGGQNWITTGVKVALQNTIIWAFSRIFVKF